MSELKLPNGRGENRLAQMKEFGLKLMEMQDRFEDKISARGWCYILEDARLINKDEFNKGEKIINDCRKQGFLPVDFTAQDGSRELWGREPDEDDEKEYIVNWIKGIQNNITKKYAHEFNSNQEYYLVVMVEKIDLRNLFSRICNDLQIPIANARGWSDINLRNNLIKKFAAAKERGQKPVLLYCGDYDPAGIDISNTLKKNLNDLENATGYNTNDLDLEVDRFGINLDFIEENNLVWIDNLMTATGGHIASLVNGEIVQGKTKKGAPHPDFNKPSVQKYLREVGVRKVEANALIVAPEKGKELLLKAIYKYHPEEVCNSYLEERKVRREHIDEVLAEHAPMFEELKNSIMEVEDE